MPAYLFRCSDCKLEFDQVRSIKEGPPPPYDCPSCVNGTMEHIILPPMIHCSGDPDHVPPEFGIQRLGHTGGTNAAEAARIEAKYQKDIERKRAMKREAGKSKRAFNMTQSIPAPLYYGKIKQTGDSKYWDDPKNRSKHRSTIV